MGSVVELPPDEELLEYLDDRLDMGDDEYDHSILASSYKMESGIAAKKLQQLADADRAAQRRGDADLEWFTDTVALEAGSGTGKVSNDLALALQVTESLPKTLALLAAGELDLYRVRKIADAARALTAEQCTLLEDKIYPTVLDMNLGRLQRRVNKVVADLDAGAAEQRRQRSRADRHVWCEPEPLTGMGWLTAYLPGDDLASIAKRLDTLATSTNDGVRTMDQRRADTLRDLLLHVPGAALDPTARAPGQSWRGQSRDAVSTTGTNPAVGTAGATRPTNPSESAIGTGAGSVSAGGGCGVAATIYVTVSAETLLGLDQRAAELRGYGPITAEHARELAYQLQSAWIGVLVDNNGRAITMTRNSYRFRGRLAELIRLRDATCTHPGCDRPADRCDIDHVIPWPRGQTTPDNASTECRRHHRMKTLTDWTITRNEEQVMWTKPDGQSFANRTEPIAATSPPPKRANRPEGDPPPF